MRNSSAAAGGPLAADHTAPTALKTDDAGVRSIRAPEQAPAKRRVAAGSSGAASSPAVCLACNRPALGDRAFCHECDAKVTRRLALWARGYKTARPTPASPEAHILDQEPRPIAIQKPGRLVGHITGMLGSSRDYGEE